jgi:hypothetical protein
MSQNKMPTEIFYGREFVANDKEFSEALQMIESAYLDFFENRPPHDEREKHARLHDYYFVYTSNGIITLSFLPERDLRNDIKMAVIHAFVSIYPPTDM